MAEAKAAVGRCFLSLTFMRRRGTGTTALGSEISYQCHSHSVNNKCPIGNGCSNNNVYTHICPSSAHKASHESGCSNNVYTYMRL